MNLSKNTSVSNTDTIHCKHGCHSVSEISRYLQEAPMAKCNGCSAFVYEDGLAMCKYLTLGK